MWIASSLRASQRRLPTLNADLGERVYDFPDEALGRRMTDRELGLQQLGPLRHGRYFPLGRG